MDMDTGDTEFLSFFLIIGQYQRHAKFDSIHLLVFCTTFFLYTCF